LVSSSALARSVGVLVAEARAQHAPPPRVRLRVGVAEAHTEHASSAPRRDARVVGILRAVKRVREASASAPDDAVGVGVDEAEQTPLAETPPSPLPTADRVLVPETRA
jgi:hypothetical protein